PGVNRLRLPGLGRSRTATSGGGFWHGLAGWVMRRPLVVLIPATGFLLLAGSPFLSLRLANGNVDMLPTRLEARQGFDTLTADFPGQGQTTFNIVVNYPDGSPLTAPRIADQYALEQRIAAIPNRTPLAIGFVVVLTYVVLFFLTGSVILPLKAVVLNMLSIGASFGALVWIFQQGHLSNILAFTPQSTDPSIPVILFSIVFGLSMDY